MAADISGKWTGNMPGRGGDTAPTTFTFKVDGEKLTGNVRSFHLYAWSFYAAAIKKTLAGPSISIPLPSRPSTFAKCFPNPFPDTSSHPSARARVKS